MTREVRFGDFTREIQINQQFVSYNHLTPKTRFDGDGREVPYHPPRLTLRGIDVYRLLTPYVSVRLISQIKAVVPLALYLIFFQILILRQTVLQHNVILFGILAVIVGLMVFMEGLKLGLMPFGEIIGHRLPQKSKLPLVLFISLLLGVGVTFAEPAIGALQAVGSIVDPRRAPYLYILLNAWSDMLVLVVGLGVGLAAVVGTLRFLNGWSLKPLVYATLLPTLALTVYCMADAELSKVLGLAWDCGAVTTGPVTVPLVLSLGIGIAAAAGRGSSSLSGFGIVTLASLFPIIGVMALAIYVSATVPVESILLAAESASHTQAAIAWYERTPWQEIIGGMRAIVPLVLFLFLVLRFILRERMRESGIVLYGLTLSVAGMILFNVGLSFGLAKLGNQSGGFIPAAFTELDSVKESPLYHYSIGIALALVFAWVLGFGATLAEPALNALGQTVENLTNGTFRKKMLMYSVSAGVGFGITAGILKIIFDLPLGWLLIPTYLIAVGLTALSSEEFVNVAWDSAGVTTGPVTVPLVLAMGLGFGDAVKAIEGFGILSMASIGPILSVLLTGLWIQGPEGLRKRFFPRLPAAAVAEVIP
ncbi:MAG: hypothetical protein COV67_00685 [Nitrospinae bacterium CG11_big_fil_rev_8_21_14_0_20_56_8]|nr:MAG: hypothetical protein COV67_00685 [Nitrospinae bacterium CG11_big_fil_rev_8_21_14_0_20_56_8]